MIEKSILVVTVLVLLGCKNDSTPDSSLGPRKRAVSLIYRLAKTTTNTDRDIMSAFENLVRLGPTVFPVLLEHLGDDRPSHPTFGMAVKPSGRLTVGNGCFLVFRDQVEGPLPKGFRSYWILAPDTTREWWLERKGLSLPELRLEAARSSLEKARADKPGDLRDGALRFFEERVRELEKTVSAKAGDE